MKKLQKISKSKLFDIKNVNGVENGKISDSGICVLMQLSNDFISHCNWKTDAKSLESMFRKMFRSHFGYSK